MLQKSSGRLRAWGKYLESSKKLSKVNAAAMVLYMDDDIIALNKPPGLAVHDGPSLRTENTLTSKLGMWQFDRDTPPSLAHRIDKNTSGVLLLSRSVESARRMASLFATQAITKKYCALCVGVPDNKRGSIKIPLGVKNISTVKKQRPMHRVILRPDRTSDFDQARPRTTAAGRVQLAWTNYSVITQHDDLCSMIDVTPVTGFRHQIRVHLADGLLVPVIGDYKFAGPLFRLKSSLAKKMSVIGSTKGFTRGPMYLHAYQVVIPRDEGKPLVITAPLPSYYKRTVQSLRLNIPKHYQLLTRD